MKAAYKKSFTKDLRNLQHHPAVLGDVRSVIEAVEAAESLRDVANCRKIKTAREDYYRIRIGDYRIGLCLFWPKADQKPLFSVSSVTLW